MKNIPIHPSLWWGLPLALLLANLAAELVVPVAYKPHFYSEGGPVEKVQEIILFLSVLLAVGLSFKVDGLWLRSWFGVATVSLVYVLGEEVSWGQHYFGWATPEFWAGINDQQETNLHNTSQWLDQKPKILLQIGVLVGGLIIPAFLKWAPDKLPRKFSLIYPDQYVVVTALFTLGIKLLETVQDFTPLKVLWRPSEVLELYIYYFVMIYLIVMWKRFKGSLPANA